MNHHPANIPDLPEQSERSGVTLVEVLMALMIMSIGVSAVAVLFPISALRSIQASQLTNGAIVKYNVETVLDNQPEIIFDPDGDLRLALRLAPGNAREQARRAAISEHFRLPGSRNYIVDPVGFYTHFADGNGAQASVFGNDGSVPFGVPRFGGGLLCTDGQDHTTSTLHAQAMVLKARAFAAQGDGWETLVDAPPIALVAGGVQLSADSNLSDVPTSELTLPADGSGGYLVEDPENYRIVLFSAGGKFSQALPLVSIDNSTNTCYYAESAGNDVNMNGIQDLRTLPAEFGGVVDRVLLQYRKVSDYSWMLNVRRRGDGQARSVDVVVRFNDGISTSDERVYEAAFVPSTSTTTSYSVWVRLPSRSNASDNTEPNIRKGKFIFDATNGVWYRIQDVQERPLFGTGNANWANFDYLVLTEQPIRVSDGAGTLAGAGPFAPAMFPTGIVDVYPMGSCNLPEYMQVSAF